MSDTPLTDKRCEESQKLLKMATRFAWMCDHARRLERENAALRKNHSEAIQQAIREHIADYEKFAPGQEWGAGALHCRIFAALNQSP